MRPAKSTCSGLPSTKTLALIWIALIVAACQPADPPAAASPTPAQSTRLPAQTTPAEPISTQTVPAAAVQPSPTISLTPAPAVTALTPQPTSDWITITNNEISAPILMYHHIASDHPDNRYYVSSENFRAQMDLLHQEGYTAITLRVLADALRCNGPLPARPVVITFDDGDLDVYQNAFPIMRDYGYPGTFFILSSALQADGFVHTEQLQELITAGWEIGSHSMSHADLAAEGADIHREMYQSRIDLEAALHVTVNSFAYPFSSSNALVLKKARQYQYNTAVCSGWNNEQRLSHIYCLSRREVKWQTDLEAFRKFLQAR